MKTFIISHLIQSIMITRYLKSLFLIILTLIVFYPFIITSEGFSQISSTESPDIILFNGEVITMEEINPLVEALAIKDDLIITIGDKNEILALGGSNTCYIDLQGKTIVPGFIDAHSHWIGDRGLTNQTELDEVIETLVRNGWTSISELFVNQDRLNELQATDEADLLRVRVNAYLPLSWQFERFGDWYQMYQPGYEYSSTLRIAGVKFFMDGWYKNPVLYFNQSELEELFQEAHDLGFQIAIHSVVTNATEVVLNAFEKVLGVESNTQRHRIEHLVLLNDELISRMADLGILGCIQLSWFNSDWTETDIGQENFNLIARWRALLDAGVLLMGSTDYPYTFLDIKSPLQVISMVVTRVGLEGHTPYEWMLNQTITPEEALSMLTIDAAYGTFQENVKGSIKEGKYADLVILSNNPLTIPEEEISNIKILMTMIGGKQEYIADTFEMECTTLHSTSTQTKSSFIPTTTSVPIIATFLAIFVLYYFKEKRRKL